MSPAQAKQIREASEQGTISREFIIFVLLQVKVKERKFVLSEERLIHLGQTGSKSAPDVLLGSDEDGYQAIIDNKAYSKYSISGDHHNRMVHNFIGNISSYSDSNLPIGFFTYISGGFIKTIDQQISEEVNEPGVNGSAIKYLI